MEFLLVIASATVSLSIYNVSLRLSTKIIMG